MSGDIRPKSKNQEIIPGNFLAATANPPTCLAVAAASENSASGPQETAPDDGEIEWSWQGELYRAIVDAGRFAEPEPANKGGKIEICVTNDVSIRVFDEGIVLENHQLFAFNALIMTRRPSTAAELCAYGFDPRADRADFTRALDGLSEAFEQTVGFDLIGRLCRGENSLYVLNPNVVMLDSRRLTGTLTGRSRGKGPESVGNTDMLSPTSLDEVEFGEYSERDAAIQRLLNAYNRHPEVIKRIEGCRVRKGPTANAVDSLEHYFNLAREFPLLSRAEETELFSHIEAGLQAYRLLSGADAISPEAEEKFITLVTAHQVMHLSNLLLVVSIAKPKASAASLPLLDLIQEGNLGLQKAISRFDYRTGNKFSTYASPWIHQGVDRAQQNLGRIIRVPVGQQEIWAKIKRAEGGLTIKLKREPTEAELAKATGYSVDKIRSCREAIGNRPASLDLRLGDGVTTLGDILPDKQFDEDSIVSRLSARTDIGKLFASTRLDDREKLVLALRNGVHDMLPDGLKIQTASGEPIDYQKHVSNGRQMTLEAIGKLLGLTWGGVRRIEAEALKEARRIIEDS